MDWSIFIKRRTNFIHLGVNKTNKKDIKILEKIVRILEKKHDLLMTVFISGVKILDLKKKKKEEWIRSVHLLNAFV